MIIKNCKTEMDWVAQINSWLEVQVGQHKAQSLFLPAGDTPRPLYQDWEAQRPAFLQRLEFLQVDEVLGDSGASTRLFRTFFEECLPSYQEQMVYIDDAGCVADLAILGLGLNGHVAFHEPQLPPEFFSGCLRLDTATVERLRLPKLTYGVSYGLGAFLRAKAIALIVRGETKKAVLDKVLQDNCALPAAQLKSHADLTLLTV